MLRGMGILPMPEESRVKTKDRGHCLGFLARYSAVASAASREMSIVIGISMEASDTDHGKPTQSARERNRDF